MYNYPFPKGEPGSEDEEEDITGLFETDNPRIRGTMAQLAYAYDRAELEGDEALKAQIIQEAKKAKSPL